MPRDTTLTGVERFFDEDELIVSKTDLKGHITYANDVFLRVAGMTEKETLGQPHSCIRYPEMPRAVFKLLWDTLQQGNEIFAYRDKVAAFNGVIGHFERASSKASARPRPNCNPPPR